MFVGPERGIAPLLVSFHFLSSWVVFHIRRGFHAIRQSPMRQICGIELYKFFLPFYLCIINHPNTSPKLDPNVGWLLSRPTACKLTNKSVYGEVRDLLWYREVCLKRNRQDILKIPLNSSHAGQLPRVMAKFPEKGRRVQEIYWAVCPPASIQNRENDGL